MYTSYRYRKTYTTYRNTKSNTTDRYRKHTQHIVTQNLRQQIGIQKHTGIQTHHTYMYTHSQTLDVTYFHTHQRKTFEYRNTPID